MPPRHALPLTLSLSTLLFAACSDRPEAPRPEAPPEPVIQAAAPLPPAPKPEVPEVPHVEELVAEGAFVVRGRGPGHAVLFGGQCAQPQGYAEAIKHAAARRGHLVALRGDKPCAGEYRGWTFDLAAVSGRIDRTFRALGLGEPADVLLIGYSQGASVAEMLAAREPERFTRLVLIAKPSDPEPWRFRKIKAVVTMAGTRDDQARMERASRTLGAAGVKARYFPLPGATHGEMGDDPEGTFDAVMDWLHAPSGS